MRVLLMAHAYPPHHNAGAEMTAHALLRHLAAEGHDALVLLSRPGPATEPYSYEGVVVQPHVGQSDPFPWFDGRVDVVLTHLENTPRASILGEMYGVPVVHLLHNDHDWTKHCIRRTPPALAVFNSEWMAAEYGRWLDAVREPTLPSVVVHPPVVPGDYATTHGDRVTLINLNEDKGGHLFWRLAHALPERKFLGVRGAYGEQVERPPFWPDGDNFEVLDHQPPSGMPAIYGRTKVLLMPSVYESWGRTAIEAANSGIPTIAHPTPGLVESLGDAGIFVDRDDVAGWVRAIKTLHTPRGYFAASKRAHARAAQLDPTPDLDLFARAMEKVAARGSR